jgi:hypothetical protein
MFDAFYDLQPNATCADCGTDYSRADNDPSHYCDGCSDRRDAHTSMLERRLTMAAAKLKPGIPAPKLTSSEIAFCVALLGQGWPLDKAIDRVQVLRSRLPFTPTTGEAA